MVDPVDPETIGLIVVKQDLEENQEASTSSSTAGSEVVHPPTPAEELERIERERRESEERERIAAQERDRIEREERERQEATESQERERIEREERERLEQERIGQEEQIDMSATERREAVKAQKELLDIVNGQIRKLYAGDVLGLPTFLSGIEIARDFAYTEELKEKLVSYVKGRLEGRAREIITDDVDDIDDLIARLKDNIRPENSKIIEGRISSLRYSYAKQEEFAAKTEELADALRRTLILEGMTPDKANEITIDRTITLCRKNTTSDVVKAVLSAAQFNTAKEVVAKLITSNDESVKDRQVLRYQKDNRGFPNRGKFNRGRGYQNNYNNRGKGSKV